MIEMIRRAGVFLIAAKTMYHFAAGGRYERYVRLLIRLMTLAVILIPVLDLVKGGAGEHFAVRLAQFEMRYEKMTGAAEFPSLDLTQEKIVLETQEEISGALAPLLSQYGYRIKEASLRDGRLYFQLVPKDYGNSISIPPIGEIKIADDETSKEDGSGNGEVMKSVIAARLCVDEEWVEVRILE